MPSERDAVEETDEVRLLRLRAGMYAALGQAIERWGGAEALARLWGCSLSQVSLRLNRAEKHGVVQHAFLEYAAIACTHDGAAEGFMFALADLLGFERPKRKREKTEHEKFAALVKTLRLAGPLGEAAIERAARDLGAHASEFEP